MQRRVVITGIGGLTGLGHDFNNISTALTNRQSAVRRMPEWVDIEAMHTKLAAPVASFNLPEHYDRKRTRSMSPLGLMATRSAELALEDANLLNDPILTSGHTGIAHGACAGSAKDIMALGQLGMSRSLRGISANTYVRMMSHTGAVNISLFFGINGRIIPSSSACTSASQAMGFSYEAIQSGKQTIMLAGGGEELSIGTTAIFDRLYATSTHNDTPTTTPRPFDKNRDGLVVGEGAVTLVLEELEHARQRNARIYAEIIGFATNADGTHITQPNAHAMQAVMQLALADASIEAHCIDYINAHGTATEQGDIAESHATHAVFGTHTPISSLKGHFGHTLGTCGALEAWLSIEMMRQQRFIATLNLAEPDPACAELDYIIGDDRHIDSQYIMSNNFAFGGINTSLIFKRWQQSQHQA